MLFSPHKLLCTLLLLFSVSQVTRADDGERLFALKVLSTFKSKCFSCHNAANRAELKGEFDMSSLSGLLQGGESAEPAIVPNQPENSPLLNAILWEGLEMPPKENDRLTSQQISDIRKWIVLGAPWPDDKTIAAIRKEHWGDKITSDGELVSTSGGLSEEWTYRRYKPENIWAFRKLPPARVFGEDTQPIDHFVSARLAEAGFSLAPVANPEMLVRRAYFDLTGLPPTPQESAAFLSQWKTDPDSAWEDLIDRLLASPRYGERWAQHWLDVVRYADTGGYSNDYERSNAWRYRDYVIRSLNGDKPYNQFIVEQIAGDELTDRSIANRINDQKAVAAARYVGDYNPQEAEWIVATGFLRMGPFDNAMVKIPTARQIFIDDVVNSVGQTFLSTTLRCVKCHDHKFDPIPTRDYYRFYAAFAATQLAERAAPLLEHENQSDFASNRDHVQSMLAFATSRKLALEKKREDAARKWFAQRGLDYKNVNQRRALPDDVKPPRHVGLNTTEQGQLKVYTQDEWIWRRRLERFQPMAQSVFNAADSQIKQLNTRSLRIIKAINNNATTHSTIFEGGALEAKGSTVQPGVLSTSGLPSANPTAQSHLLPKSINGRRLALAKWIANDDNPLTTRSIVNRIWQYHFGKGIAANSMNFGTTGAKPTHPELLDWLAANFVENGWRIKRLHKLIMTSRTYMQSTTRRDLQILEEVDPENTLLGRFIPRRLSAEEIRDAMLSATGELNLAIGGLPVNPEINMEVALQPRMIQFSIAPAYQPSPLPAQRHRRSIYAYKVRGQADPFLEIFNQPNPNESCEVRDQMSVTPQAFTLLNSDVTNSRSIAMAQRLEKDSSVLTAKIQRAFSLILGRAPSASELRRMRQYVSDMTKYHEENPTTPRTFPTSITRSLVEELSGDVFEYQEILPVYENYQADPHANNASPSTRAIADLCLLLFNTNEFCFVY